MNNIYFEQRNFAYGLPSGAEKCAWRLVILSHKKANQSDKSNYEVDCKDQLSINVEPIVQDIKSKIRKWSVPPVSEYPEMKQDDKDLAII